MYVHLAERQRHVALTNPEEAAHPDHHGFGLAGLIEQDLPDVPDLLVIVVVNVQSLQLRRAPLARLLLGQELTRLRRGRRVRGR